MSELAARSKEKVSRVVRRIDTPICLAIFIAASMPAIIVMFLLAFPLLPLLAVWVSFVATTGGPTQTAGHLDHREHDAGPADRPVDHVPPLPRYA